MTVAEAAIGEAGQPGRTLAQQLELPALVAHALSGHRELPSLIQALLTMTEHEVERRGDVLLLPGAAVIVIPAQIGEQLGKAALDMAYGRFLSSGRPCGVMVTPGLLPAGEVQAMERIDPRLTYAGLLALQSMAEAAAAGEDPLAAWLPVPQNR